MIRLCKHSMVLRSSHLNRAEGDDLPATCVQDTEERGKGLEIL